MKIKTIETLSLGIAFTAALFTALFEIVAGAMWLYLLLSFTMTFVSVFFVARYFIKKFVIYKLKPIYQIIVAKNISTHQATTELSSREDIVEEIRDELTEWADKKSEEISRLKDNERYRKEFLGNVAHEIRTPIFTIQGYILTLLDGALEDNEINRRYLERAEKGIDRLINIVNDLDEISRLESRVISLNHSRFDIIALTREIIESMEMEASRRGISLTIRTANSRPVYVYADRPRVSQVLVNLIVNSVKYGRDGGATAIGFVDMYDKVMVEVSDNGLGIDKEHLGRIFERFYRVDKSRSREQGGTGLGLAIVKHIVEAHGETVGVRSEVDKGSTFSFTLAKSQEPRTT